MSIGGRALRGALWLSVGNYAAYVAAFAADVLLARWLFPTDFGLVALAVSITEILGRLSSLGLGTIVVQFRAADSAQESRFLSTLFSIQLIVAAFIVVAIGLLAPIFGVFYGHEVIAVLVVLAAGRSIQTLNELPSALIQKRMIFREDALISVVSLAGSSVLGVLLAWQGFGPWSLVCKRLSQVVIRGAGVWWVAHWRPGLSWDREALGHVWRFSQSMWLSGNLQVLLRDLDDTAVGTVGDVEALGYYSRSYKLARLFVEFIAPAIARTALPIYSHYRDQQRELSSVFGIVQRFVGRMSALFCLELGLLAPIIVVALYTERWLPMVAVFRVMLVYAYLEPLFNQHTLLLMAVGRPDVVGRVRVIQTVFFAPGVFAAAALWGGEGVAVVVDAVAVIGFGLILRETRRIVSFSAWRTIGHHVGAALLAAFVFWIIPGAWLPAQWWVRLLVYAATVAIVFLAGLGMLEGRVLYSDVRRVVQGLGAARQPGTPRGDGPGSVKS